jgi:ubiquinone biosynthesis protein
MQVQPQLLLLQKNMMMAEGTSRSLAPDLNIWTLSQPLIEQWIRQHRGPGARLAKAGADLNRAIARVPQFLTDIEVIASDLRLRGVKLSAGTLERLERASGRGTARISLLVSGIALVIALIALL